MGASSLTLSPYLVRAWTTVETWAVGPSVHVRRGFPEWNRCNAVTPSVTVDASACFLLSSKTLGTSLALSALKEEARLEFFSSYFLLLESNDICPQHFLPLVPDGFDSLPPALNMGILPHSPPPRCPSTVHHLQGVQQGAVTGR